MQVLARTHFELLLVLLCTINAVGQETCPTLSQNEADCTWLGCGNTCEEGKGIAQTNNTIDGCVFFKCCDIVIPCGGASPPPPPALSAPVAVGVCETMGILNDTACQRECNTTFGASHTFREITVNETDAQPQVKNQCTCINWWNGSSYDPEIDLCEGSTSRPATVFKMKQGDNTVQRWQIVVVVSSIALFVLVSVFVTLIILSRRTLRRRRALAENLLVDKRKNNLERQLSRQQSSKRHGERSASLTTQLQQTINVLSPVKEGGTPNTLDRTPDTIAQALSPGEYQASRLSANPSPAVTPRALGDAGPSFKERLDQVESSSQEDTPKRTPRRPRGVQSQVNTLSNLASELKAKLQARQKLISQPDVSAI